MSSSPLVPVIMSGGAGTRLWPLSREASPKPFMPLPDGQTLLAKTATRALALPGAAALLTVTNREHYFATKDVYTALPVALPAASGYLLEPFGRNTAPAVAMAALAAEARHGGDAVLLVLAADHLIRDQAGFAAAVARATALAREGALVTFGISPTRPETGFGYVECGGAIAGADAAVPAFAARRFVEKPPLAQAQAYLDAGTFVWNSGMFCFTARAIIDAFAQHAPAVLAAARASLPDGTARGEAMLEIDPVAFAGAPDVSIDYAVMEPAAAAGAVAVVRGTFDWSDIGSWQAVAGLVSADADGNSGQGMRVSIGTRNTYLHSEDRVVAAVGVDNLVVIDTPDAVLVAHRDHLQRVKEVVTELKARNHAAYHHHLTVGRPWGAYTVLQEGPGFKIKRIEVKPGASLSLQSHRRRSEHWVVVQGIAEVTRGEDVFAVASNESTFIPLGTKHRLANRGTAPLVMIEVQCGDYVGEDDIVRYDDIYGRVRG